MEFKREIIINKPIENVWEILGNQFGSACEWASGINHSNTYGQSNLPDTPWNNRACDTTSGKIKEELTMFNPANYELEYKVLEGFPFFVDLGKNNWKLTKVGPTTKVSMHMTIITKGIVGRLMSPMMKMQINKLADNVINDLKHYTETGKPSPMKAKELKNLAKQAA